ncbi:hypothetical protein HK105_206934 [Polyrhizophydium stewartii]|uniref:SET domain-containing protein n=1 Tax=Polyrhizophydium stewartii TaxID=2732419 RepID=A0ABR4N1U2_9FUNG
MSAAVDDPTRAGDEPLPAGWPEDVEFLTELWWAAGIPAEVRARYEGGGTSGVGFPDDIDIMQVDAAGHAAVNERVRICEITDERHPSHGQRGLYAAHALAAHTHVLDYRGVVQSDDGAAVAESDYSVHMHGALSVDAAAAGNEARFINDFRGVAGRPNVALDTYRDAADGRVRVGVFTLNAAVAAGEELLVTYGRAFWRARGVQSSEPDWDPAWDD